MAKKKVFSIGSSLSDGLEQTFAAAHNYSSALQVDVIPLQKIELDPENPRDLLITLQDVITGLNENDPEFDRKISELKGLETLSNSIRDQGIINPIVVYEHNGLYRLIAGERRTLASLLAKKPDIQAKIIDGKPSELKIRVLQWIENIERTDLSLIERLNNLEKIVQAFADENKKYFDEVRITDISQLIGCTKSHAISLKAVLTADDDIKKLIATDKIRSLEKAALLASINAPLLREKAIKECLNGATLKKIKLLVAQDKSLTSTEESLVDPIAVSKMISFGSTQNINVAQLVLESIVKNTSLAEEEINNICFESPKEIEKSFKFLIKKMELASE